MLQTGVHDFVAAYMVSVWVTVSSRALSPEGWQMVLLRVRVNLRRWPALALLVAPRRAGCSVARGVAPREALIGGADWLSAFRDTLFAALLARTAATGGLYDCAAAA